MKSVLLVDDEMTFQLLGKILFRSIGLPPGNYHNAESGQQALEKIAQLHEQGKGLPDLILLDLYMPSMDGFGFLEAFHKTTYPDKEKVSVIVLTSSHDEKDMERVNQFPNTRYMTKPLDEASMRAELGL